MKKYIFAGIALIALAIIVISYSLWPKEANLSRAQLNMLKSLNPQILELDFFKEQHTKSENERVFKQIIELNAELMKRHDQILAELKTFKLTSDSNLKDLYAEVKKLAQEKYNLAVDSAEFDLYVDGLIHDSFDKIGKDAEITKFVLLSRYKDELKLLKGHELKENDYDITLNDFFKQTQAQILFEEVRNFLATDRLSPTISQCPLRPTASVKPV